MDYDSEPRLSDTAARLAHDYVEQSNFVKIIMPEGDIGFIIAADATSPMKRDSRTIADDMVAKVGDFVLGEIDRVTADEAAER